MTTTTTLLGGARNKAIQLYEEGNGVGFIADVMARSIDVVEATINSAIESGRLAPRDDEYDVPVTRKNEQDDVDDEEEPEPVGRGDPVAVDVLESLELTYDEISDTLDHLLLTAAKDYSKMFGSQYRNFEDSHRREIRSKLYDLCRRHEAFYEILADNVR